METYIMNLLLKFFSSFVIFLSLSIYFIFLMSCAPSTAPIGSATTQTPSTGGSTGSTTKVTSEQACKKDSSDDTEICSEEEDCVEDCKALYTRTDEKIACKKLSIRQVGKIQEIFNELKAAQTSTLNKIAEEDDDYELSDLECYLSISGSGLTNEVDKSSFTVDKARSLLKWLAENNNVSEVLSKVEDGEKVLEKLLLKAKQGSVSISAATLTAPAAAGTAKNLWKIESQNLKIKIYGGASPSAGEEEISFNNNDDATLYNALSARHWNNKNIFSYSEENAGDDDNQVLFDMAFNLLNRVCEDADSNSNEQTACRKALLCWTASNSGSSAVEATESQYDSVLSLAENHESALGGSSDYKKCSAGEFYDLFN